MYYPPHNDPGDYVRPRRPRARHGTSRDSNRYRGDDDYIPAPSPASHAMSKQKQAAAKIEFKIHRNRAVTQITLLAFTTAMHARLPREVRDMIYAYLLEENTMILIQLSSRQSLDAFPWYYTTLPKEDQPNIIKPGIVAADFAKEVIEQFYLAYNKFEVRATEHIAECLDTDFFDMRVRPKDTLLSAFTVTGNLDAKRGEDEYIDWSKIEDHFKPLLDIKQQKWRQSGFQLNVILSSSINIWTRDPQIDEGAVKVSRRSQESETGGQSCRGKARKGDHPRGAGEKVRHSSKR